MRTTKQQQINELELKLKAANTQIQREAESKRKAIDNTEVWINGDKTRRNEFAKAFGWTTGGYGSSKNEYPTWAEIFVHVGKLLNDVKFLQVQDRQDQIDLSIMEINNAIFNLQNQQK
jgi:hypothetical protein